MGVRRELLEEREEIMVGVDGIVVGEIKAGRGRWRIIGVYVDEGIEELKKKLESWLDRTGEGWKILLGGDFNARVGKEGGGVEGEGGERQERKAKDEVINGEGRRLVEWVEEMGWGIMNGSMKGDEEGEFTFTGGRGNTTIDLVIGDVEVRESIEYMEIGDRIDSDHHPVEVEVKGKEWKRRKGKGEKKEWRGVWDEEGREVFRQRLGEVEGGRSESSEDIEVQWKGMEERLKTALREVEEERGEGSKAWKGRGWWDGECREEKKRVRNLLRRWRRRGEEEEEYRR